MGWFDEQIRQRKKSDEEVFSDTFIHIAGAVMGDRVTRDLQDERLITQTACDEILKYYHLKTREIPPEIRNTEEQLEYLLRPHGIMHRTVELTGEWYHDAIGAMLGTRKEDGRLVAFLPAGLTGYIWLDPKTGKRERLSAKNRDQFNNEAIAFYKPFPLRKVTVPDLLRYMLETIRPADVVLVLLSMGIVTLIGMLLPKINQLLFSDVITSDSVRLLWAITVFLISVNIANLLFSTIRSILLHRLNSKISISTEAASMMRMLSLPADFFKGYSAGELSSRMSNIGSLCNMLVSTILSGGLASLFSLVYITQIFAYAPSLVIPAISITVLTILFTLVSTVVQTRFNKQRMELSAKESGVSYALISGVQKIRLSGAEKRAFAKWGNVYAKTAKMAYDPPAFIKLNTVISLAIASFGTVVLYSAAVKSGVSVANYYAFQTAYGMVSGGLMSLTGIVTTLAMIRPVLDMAKPILDAVPEVSEGKQMVTRLSGAIELNNVSFRYGENMPYVLNDISLKIRPGQYVAIVGKTGCGKSTLMRLLLGFEKPQKGAIYYDGKDMSTLDLKSLRQKIGAVTQDGKLFQGDLFSNITISAPDLSMDEAWEAAEMAGMAEDIRSMPMGMHTIISEGGGGISGGQRQRLMIARAIAPKPKILMFDEATSALDNITQKKVAESLDQLKCTRIVIAHRLSTVRHCDRILVLDNGRIVEDGTYDSLVEQNGLFADLVARQRLDTNVMA